MSTVLDVLKNHRNSSIGLEHSELEEGCLQAKIYCWLSELKTIIERGQVRIDEEHKPIRYKLTRLAWPESQ